MSSFAIDDIEELVVFIVLVPVVLAFDDATRTTESLTLQIV